MIHRAIIRQAGAAARPAGTYKWKNDPRARGRLQRVSGGVGYPESLARTASSTLRPEGSTPNAAKAPPSTTVSPSTSTLNSP